jgi:hypothetical protein
MLFYGHILGIGKNMVKKMSDSLNGKKNECGYECKICNFVCSYKSNYDAHLSTRKHQKMVINGNTPSESFVPIGMDVIDSFQSETVNNTTNMCRYCNKQYSHLSALSRHKKTCKNMLMNQKQHMIDDKYDKLIGLLQTMNTGNETIKQTIGSNTSADENVKVCVSDFQNTLVDATNCIKDMMVMMMSTTNQLQSKMIEVTKQSVDPHQLQVYPQSTQEIGVTGDNAIINNNSNNNNNNNNNTFNMNFFLNEKCKDAMNMKDFVNSIQLNMTDMENVGRLGYVEGMSNILIDNLQKTDVYKRPVHCSDVKRETLYVKDDNKWEREEPNHPKMVNAVLAVEQKNVALVSEWAKAHPSCMNSHTRENETYFKLSKAVTDGDKEGNIAKVIRKVAKRVAIEKE